jgi:hypothetical protein
LSEFNSMTIAPRSVGSTICVIGAMRLPPLAKLHSEPTEVCKVT